MTFVASVCGALCCVGVMRRLVAARPSVGTPQAGGRDAVGFVSLCCLVGLVRSSTRRLVDERVLSLGDPMASGGVAALRGGLVLPMSQPHTDDSWGVSRGQLVRRLFSCLAIEPSWGSLPGLWCGKLAALLPATTQ